MFYRIVGASAALLASTGTVSAQITPVSGSRGISMSIRNGGQTLASYSNSALADVQIFNDFYYVGWTQARIDSDLTSSQWSISGSARADAQFASPGTVATADSYASLSLYVDAGTHLHVYCLSGGSYGGMNSRVQFSGPGLSFLITGGQNYVTREESVLVTEAATFGFYAWGGGSASSGALPRGGYYQVRITATPVPGPSAAGLLGAAAVFGLARRRRCR